jgi:hypothetical protein
MATSKSRNLSSELFFSRYAVPVLTRLRRRDVVSGNFAVVPKAETYYASFLFLSRWVIEIEFLHDTTLRSLIIRANWTSEAIKEERYYAFHYHPAITDNPDWNCVEAYEKGPHIHFGAAGEYKITCEEDDLSLAAFLTFLASRHHRDRLQDVVGTAQVRSKKVGIRATRVE